MLIKCKEDRKIIGKQKQKTTKQKTVTNIIDVDSTISIITLNIMV